MSMEKTGRVTVQCDAILPVSDISSNGMRIPEKNIWGMKMIGNQLIAMFTFFENTLIQRPSMVPDIQAADKRKTTLKERWNPLKKNATHHPKIIACTTDQALKTTIFDAV